MAAPERARPRTGSLLQRTTSAIGGLGGRKVDVKVTGMTATLVLEQGVDAEEALGRLIAQLSADQKKLAAQLSGPRPRRASLGVLKVPSFGAKENCTAAKPLPLDTPLDVSDHTRDFLLALLEQMEGEFLENPKLYASSDLDVRAILEAKTHSEKARKLQGMIAGKPKPEAGVIIGEVIVAICRELNLIPIAEIPETDRLPNSLHESRRDVLVALLKHMVPVIRQDETQQPRLFLFADLIFAQSDDLKCSASTPVFLSQVLKRWLALEEVDAI